MRAVRIGEIEAGATSRERERVNEIMTRLERAIEVEWSYPEIVELVKLYSREIALGEG